MSPFSEKIIYYLTINIVLASFSFILWPAPSLVSPGGYSIDSGRRSTGRFMLTDVAALVSRENLPNSPTAPDPVRNKTEDFSP